MTETLYDALRSSHERQRKLCRQLLRTRPRTESRISTFTELRVEVADHAGSAWMTTAKALSHNVHHHLREEEKKFFQVSGKILSDPQKSQLAKRYRKDYGRMLKALQQS